MRITKKLINEILEKHKIKIDRRNRKNKSHLKKVKASCLRMYKECSKRHKEAYKELPPDKKIIYDKWLNKEFERVEMLMMDEYPLVQYKILADNYKKKYDEIIL